MRPVMDRGKVKKIEYSSGCSSKSAPWVFLNFGTLLEGLCILAGAKVQMKLISTFRDKHAVTNGNSKRLFPLCPNFYKLHSLIGWSPSGYLPAINFSEKSIARAASYGPRKS